MIRGLFSFALLLVAGGGGAAFLMSQAQPEISTGVQPVPASTEAARTFDEKVLAVEAAVAEAKESGTAQPISLVLTEAELTSKVAIATSDLTGGFIPTDPQIHLRPGSVLITAGVRVSGFPLNIAVTAIPVVFEGRPSFSIEQIQAPLPLPDGIKKEIDAQIAKILSPESLGLAFEVTKIEVLQGRLVLEGVAKP